MTTTISLVYRSVDSACGIAIFNEHLRMCLSELGTPVSDCNLAYRAYEPARATVLHYAPSMWTEDSSALARLISGKIKGELIVVLHGIYGPGKNGHRSDTACPRLGEHIAAIASSSSKLICLSQSALEVWRLWAYEPGAVEVRTLLHPGLYRMPSTNQLRDSYAFLGGISKSKKDLESTRLISLMKGFSERGIRLKLHGSNIHHDLSELPAWEATSGVLDDGSWSSALAGASLVLCPYDTASQTVSGIMAEALSAGKPILATGFPFAYEMRQKYPRYVHIEDRLSHWPQVAPGLMSKKLEPPVFPTWVEFSDFFYHELNAVAASSI